MRKDDKDKKKKAEELMKSSESKKRSADQQEDLGNAQIKNKVKEGQTGTLGQWTGKIRDAGVKVPVGKERLEIARKMREEATQDSLEAVRIYPEIVRKKK